MSSATATTAAALPQPLGYVDSVLQDVLTEAAGWEDPALSEAVETARKKLADHAAALSCASVNGANLAALRRTVELDGYQPSTATVLDLIDIARRSLTLQLAPSAPKWADVRHSLAVLLCGASSRPVAVWEQVLDEATTSGVLAQMRTVLRHSNCCAAAAEQPAAVRPSQHAAVGVLADAHQPAPAADGRNPREQTRLALDHDGAAFRLASERHFTVVFAQHEVEVFSQHEDGGECLSSIGIAPQEDAAAIARQAVVDAAKAADGIDATR